MKLIHQLCALLALTCLSCSAATTSPQLVQKDLASMPAKAVVQSLKRNGDYQHILDSMAKGDAAWIELAPKLYEGTDAGDSEDLEITLASALPKNAKAVLAALVRSDVDQKSKLRVDMVCAVPFIEPSDAFVEKYLKQARAAVKAVKDGKLASIAQVCLGYLK